MSEKTNIAWATSTGNPWLGCTKISPGCAHCYAAELDANRFSKTMGGGTKEKPESHWGKGAPRVRTKAFWKDAVKWNREAETLCTCESGDTLLGGLCNYCGLYVHRPRIFPSLCDIWDREVPIEWLADYLQLVFSTPNLDHLILTKRPENCLDLLFTIWDDDHCKFGARPWIRDWLDGTPPSNMWVGVSVEDQIRADERIPTLLQIPAKVRFLSVEPLLEPVKLNFNTINYERMCYGTTRKPGIDWVIVGGESGPGRRDCGVQAIASVAEQCVEAGVSCFVKQDCAQKPGQQGRICPQTWALKQFPK